MKNVLILDIIVPPSAANGKLASKLRSPMGAVSPPAIEAAGSMNGKKSSEGYAPEAGIDPLSQVRIKEERCAANRDQG